MRSLHLQAKLGALFLDTIYLKELKGQLWLLRLGHLLPVFSKERKLSVTSRETVFVTNDKLYDFKTKKKKRQELQETYL